MRIIYVAKHDSGGNDDEGAVTHALTQLGHDVQRLRESKGYMAHKLKGDLLLFHKWCNVEMLKYFKGKAVRAFWYFDLVQSKDVTLATRDQARMAWMRQVMPHVDVGFCTDGDWTDQFPSKLVRLPQGADERVIGAGSSTAVVKTKILFVGNPKSGVAREDFDRMLRTTYGSESYKNIKAGCYRRALADEMAAAEIIVAPDFPTTDRYWSNRVYIMLGFGAFLLHPYCRELAQEYIDGEEIVYYHSRQDLNEKIARYFELPDERKRIAANGLSKTRLDHAYRNRCQDLIEYVNTWKALEDSQ